jgi:hypothetical protein
MKINIKNKTKANIFRMLSALAFGTLSYWFTNRFGIEYMSIEYTILLFGVLIVALFHEGECHYRRNEKEENQKILDIFENAKKIHTKKKESN